MELSCAIVAQRFGKLVIPILGSDGPHSHAQETLKEFWKEIREPSQKMPGDTVR